ncbi:hypothetical protein [Treponema succinifaciens]|uniref:hypothetical protein n=1 Tax=Treponema succinifaciens TaxID=167 RepID=UPI003FCE7385
MKAAVSQDEGEETRKKAYSLKDFLEDCKNHQEKVILDGNAKVSAETSPLHLHGKKEILDFISQHTESDFKYVNTKIFRKGVQGEKPPVDSYKINLAYWDLYIAFCIIKTTNGWFIKSFHSDKSGETMTLGEMLLARQVGELK